MEESKIETINNAINNLKSLGLKVPYSLIIEKENEEHKLFSSKINKVINDLEGYAKKQFSGIKDKVIDITLIYNCEIESLRSSRYIAEYEEFKKKRDAIQFYKEIVLYKEGYYIRQLNYSQIEDPHISSYVTSCRFESYNDEYLILISTNNYIFGISKRLLVKQPINRLIRLPQLANFKIFDGLVCKENDIIDFVTDSYCFSSTKKSIKEIFGNNLATANCFGPLKLEFEKIEFIRID